MKRFKKFVDESFEIEEAAHKVGDMVSYEKGGKTYKSKVTKVGEKNGMVRYELSNGGFVYHSDLDESLDEAFSKKLADKMTGSKLEINANTVGAQKLQYDNDEFKLYSAYRGGKRSAWTVTDKDGIIKGIGTTPKAAMKAAKLKPAEQKELMQDKNKVIGIYRSTNLKQNRTWVHAHDSGKSIEDHDEAMKYAKSLGGKIKKANSVGAIEESKQIDEISDKKLDAYRQKAFADQPAGDDGSDKYRKRKLGRDLAFAKQTGRARVRATKEDLDEASLPLGVRSAMSSVHNVSVTANQMVSTAKSMKDVKADDVKDMDSEIDWMMERLKEAKKSLSKVKL